MQRRTGKRLLSVHKGMLERSGPGFVLVRDPTLCPSRLCSPLECSLDSNRKYLERAGSVTGEVVLCSGLVEDGGAHRLIAGDTWDLVLLLCLSNPDHGHTLVTYDHIGITIHLNS